MAKPKITPSKRIDVLRSDRQVRVEISGVTVAEPSRPMMLIETALPVRWYLPREDVQGDLFTFRRNTPSALTRLHGALRVRDLVCFWGPATV